VPSGAPVAQKPNRPPRPVGEGLLDLSRVRSRGDDGYLDVSSDEMSQTFSVLSPLPLTIRFPSGLKLTLVTKSECPLSVSVSWPVWASQTFTVLSWLPLTIRFPSGLKLTLWT